MKQYDIVYLTNSPSFYKINLFNEVGKKKKILFVFLGYTDQAVNTTLNDSSRYSFDYIFLNDSITEKSTIDTLFKLFKLLRKITYKKIFYTGWNELAFILLSYILPYRKNVIICESSEYESKITGIKGFIKKRIAKRMSTAIISGIPHKNLFESIRFKGNIIVSNGVGIFNKGIKREYSQTSSPLRYLYVGRLIELKNIEFVIRIFNENKKPLTIVGNGILEQRLKSIAKENIHFLGFVKNDELYKIYQNHDVFILPSKTEVWGVVVEEAIYNGLPVIISNKVGCNIDMVKNPKTGCIFTYNDENSLNEAISEMENNYLLYKKNAENFDFEQRDKDQIDAYVQLI